MFLIAYKHSPGASLLSMCFLIIMPQLWSQFMSLLYAVHISLDVLMVVGSKRMRLPSVLQSSMMHRLPWLEMIGNCPVWLVYIMYCMCSMLKLIFCILWCGVWMMYCSLSCCASFVYHTPWQFCCMWPFCVLSNSGKYLLTAAVMSMGLVASYPAFSAHIHVAFVGNSAAAWWY